MRKKVFWKEENKNEPLIKRIAEAIFGIFLFLAVIAVGVIAIAIATTILVKGTEAAWVYVKECSHSLFG